MEETMLADNPRNSCIFSSQVLWGAWLFIQIGIVIGFFLACVALLPRSMEKSNACYLAQCKLANLADSAK